MYIVLSLANSFTILLAWRPAMNGSVISGLKDNEKAVVMGLLGLVDPWLADLAQWIATRVPHQRLSTMQIRALGSATGGLKGVLEAKSTGLPLVWAVAFEKLLDFADFLQGVVSAERGSQKNVLEKFDRWVDDKIESARERTDVKDPQPEVLEQSRLEIACLEELRRSFHEKMGVARTASEGPGCSPENLTRMLLLMDEADNANLMRRIEAARGTSAALDLTTMLCRILTGNREDDLKILKRMNGLSDAVFTTALEISARETTGLRY